MEILEFCIYSFMASAYSDNFIFPSDLDIFLFLVWLLWLYSNIMLNKSGDCGHPCLIPDFSKKAFLLKVLYWVLLLLMLSHISRVRLCATPQMAAHQAPPSLGFSRQEHWSGLPFPSHEWKWKVKVKSLSRVWLLATPWTAAYQAPPSMGFSRQEYRSGVPLPSLIILSIKMAVSLS